MKKGLLTLAILIAAITVQAQNVRLGVSGGLNSTWLMNKNVFDQNDGLDIAASFGGRFGIEAIYSFSEKAGISIGVNFLSSHNQKYTGDDTRLCSTCPQGIDGDAVTKLRYIDVPLLFRLTSSGGTYFELGPQFGFLSSAKEDYEDNSGLISIEDEDAKGSLNSTNIALILGFGVDIDVTENLYITTGIRLGYGFSDVTKEYDENEFLSENESFANYFAHIDDSGDFNYEKTSRVFGGLHLGISYMFGSK